MSDRHTSRYLLYSHSHRPSTTSFVKQLILQLGALVSFVAAFTLHIIAPHHSSCAVALPIREFPSAFVSFSRCSSSSKIFNISQPFSIRLGIRNNLHPLHLTKNARGSEGGDNIMDKNIMNEDNGQGKNTIPFPPSLRMNSNAHAKDDTILSNEGDDDASEDNSPRRGRPGIVVFSGGTAFNAASAEMASRTVGIGMNQVSSGNNLIGFGGGDDEYDAEDISRSNSMSNLVDMMMMESMQTMRSTRSDIHRSNNAPGGGGLKVWHVLPVTDDGGSTAEIVRVLGGPAVGDIRSRLLRLAPGTTREARAVRRLLGHRLVSTQSLGERYQSGSEWTDELISRMAREEWLDILDGGQCCNMETINGNDGQNYEHPLWKDVSAPYRSVLQTHNGIRQSHSNPSFDFTGGSVGNFFFAGARTFFGSLSAAIFLFSKVAGIPSGSRVLPAVISEERLELGAELKDGTRIRGQYNISHPYPKTKHWHHSSLSDSPQKSNHQQRSRHRQVVKFSLDSCEAISSLHPSPISKIVYLLHDPTWLRRDESSNSRAQQWSDRHEISLEPNPLVLDALSNANIVVYGCGSLFTSLLPSLVLTGVGPAISNRKHVKKVLLLNGWYDCETSWTDSSGDDEGNCEVRQMDASSIVKAVVDALDQGGDADGASISLVTDYITHIFYPIGTEINIDEQLLATLCEQYLYRKSQSITSEHRQYQQIIQIQGIDSIPANTCSEGIRSGGQTHHRVFDPRALVDELLKIDDT